MRLFRQYRTILFLLVLLVAVSPVSANTDLSLSVGAQLTFLSLGVAADVGIGPLHLGGCCQIPLPRAGN